MPLEKMGDFSFSHAQQQDDLYRAMTAEEVKAAFDSRGDELKEAVNKLIDQMQSAQEGDSGAKNVGATPIVGINGNNVQAILEGLKEQIATTVLGQIPDGTVTQAKLDFNAATAENLENHSNERASSTEFGHVKAGKGLESVDGVLNTIMDGQLVIDKFDVPGTYSWTAPAGVTRVYISGCGGGGAGGGNAGAGGAGGITSFGNLISLPGGGGGNTGENATGGLSGGDGGSNGGRSGSSGTYYNPIGGSSIFGAGGFIREKGAGYGSGGGGVQYNRGAGGGGAASVIDKLVNVTPGTTYTVIIGAGGISPGDANNAGANGSGGLLLIKYVK